MKCKCDVQTLSAFWALEYTHTRVAQLRLPSFPTHLLSLFAFSCPPPGVPLACCHFLIYSLTLDIVQDVSDGDKAGEAGGAVSTEWVWGGGVSVSTRQKKS